MIKIYTSPSCSSCRKVKKWFEDNKIQYVEKNIFSPGFKKDDVKEILWKSENGTDDIISKRSKIFKEQNINVDDMKIDELLDFIVKNPSILKRPIIVDDKKIQVGYNPYDIEAFVPRARRIAEMECLLKQCDNYDCPLYDKEN